MRIHEDRASPGWYWQEHRQNTDEDTMTRAGWRVILRSANRGHGGLGFLIAPSLASQVRFDTSTVHNRIFSITAKLKAATIKIVNVWAPHAGLGEPALDNLFNDLKPHVNPYTILLGDFNECVIRGLQLHSETG